MHFVVQLLAGEAEVGVAWRDTRRVLSRFQRARALQVGVGAGVRVDGVAQLGGEAEEGRVLLGLEGAVDGLAFWSALVGGFACIGARGSGGSPVSLAVKDIFRLVVTAALRWVGLRRSGMGVGVKVSWIYRYLPVVAWRRCTH